MSCVRCRIMFGKDWGRTSPGHPGVPYASDNDGTRYLAEQDRVQQGPPGTALLYPSWKSVLGNDRREGPYGVCEGPTGKEVGLSAD